MIADFYAANAGRLRAIVAHRTHAPAEAVEDGCQTAWAILLRRPDVSLDARGFGWLTVVAVREVRHQRDGARELLMGALTLGAGETGELPEPASMHAGVDELAAAHLEYVERVADLSALKPAERTALYLQALGYRYREIAELSRGVCVNVAVLAGSDVNDMSPMEGGCRVPSAGSARLGAAALASKRRRRPTTLRPPVPVREAGQFRRGAGVARGRCAGPRAARPAEESFRTAGRPAGRR